jgi:hypothetical protein
MNTIEKFPIPGVSQPGQAGDAAPGSLLSELRATAAQKRKSAALTLELPGKWKGKLRVRYGTVSLAELERFQSLTPADVNMGTTLEMLSCACRAVEAIDPTNGEWLVLEDELGPVKFDDRLARLLQWERPDPDFTFSSLMVYEGMFDGDGFAIMRHAGEVNQFLGLVEGDIASGKLSTVASLTPSASPLRSE